MALINGCCSRSRRIAETRHASKEEGFVSTAAPSVRSADSGYTELANGEHYIVHTHVIMKPEATFSLPSQTRYHSASAGESSCNKSCIRNWARLVGLRMLIDRQDVPVTQRLLPEPHGTSLKCTSFSLSFYDFPLSLLAP
ncbi:hypothetical protein PV04_05326 [Phialophora macrospora]|uniref:Uncharacterized protein n=1 Tax=Phialophora macrospora TaxID=1851006 RepID=A0A0D2GBL6_9EURO|nr:hypothetical protein PV04_05326 [Phialophora macrospora]